MTAPHVTAFQTKMGPGYTQGGRFGRANPQTIPLGDAGIQERGCSTSSWTSGHLSEAPSLILIAVDCLRPAPFISGYSWQEEPIRAHNCSAELIHGRKSPNKSIL